MRNYYNRRVGKDGERPRLTLAETAKQVSACYDYLLGQAYLQEAFGYHCADAGEVPGLHGSDLRTHFYLTTGIRIDESVSKFLDECDEVGLFTAIEFLHDFVARPDEGTGRYHSFSNCGWHFDCRSSQFDSKNARAEYRERINAFLKFYEDGYELTGEGEVVRIMSSGLAELVAAPAPTGTPDVNVAKLANAVRTFRRGVSTREERKNAVRDLVDLLEFYRPQVKTHLLSKDESDLFNIANNYAIRHHRTDQKDGYGEHWLTWMFCFYLSTVHLVLSLVHGGTDIPAPASSSRGLDQDDDIPF